MLFFDLVSTEITNIPDVFSCKAGVASVCVDDIVLSDRGSVVFVVVGVIVVSFAVVFVVASVAFVVAVDVASVVDASFDGLCVAVDWSANNRT